MMRMWFLRRAEAERVQAELTLAVGIWCTLHGIQPEDFEPYTIVQAKVLGWWLTTA